MKDSWTSRADVASALSQRLERAFFRRESTSFWRSRAFRGTDTKRFSPSCNPRCRDERQADSAPELHERFFLRSGRGAGTVTISPPRHGSDLDLSYDVELLIKEARRKGRVRL